MAQVTIQIPPLQPGDTLTLVVPGASPPPPPPGPPSPPSPPVPSPVFDLSLPIANVQEYLVQSLNADGSPPLAGPGPRLLSARDTFEWTRTDYPDPGYFASEAYIAPNFWATTWRSAPYSSFNPAAGDGGEVYVDNGTTVRAVATQDGGSPGMQWFVGPKENPPGDGWVIFDYLAPTGSWRGIDALLSESADPNALPPLGNAYTRWRREVLTIPFTLLDGTVMYLTDLCVIYEHYVGSSIAGAASCEQAIWMRGQGRVYWANRGPGPAPVDLSQRLPWAPPWPGPSERPDWNPAPLDARLWTRFKAVAPGETNTIVWPPPGFTVQ